MSNDALTQGLQAQEADGRLILEQLFRRHHGSIQAYFLRQGVAQDQAQELAQETFLRAWRGIEGFRSAASPSTWLFTIARNILYNFWRDRRAAKRDAATLTLSDDSEDAMPVPCVDPGVDPEHRALDEERQTLLRGEIDKLPTQMRQCLLLRHNGLRYREIADVLGVSIETVKSHLHQARQRLTLAMGRHFEIDLDDPRRETT